MSSNSQGGSMPLSPDIKEQKTTSELQKSISRMQEVFGNDFTLVQKAAADHGVKATKGELSTLLSNGDYNQRIPSNSDINNLLQAKTFLIQCMDRRTSFAHAAEVKADLSMSMAGGGAQPNNIREDRNRDEDQELRRNTLVEFLNALYKEGKLETIILSGHDGICGGMNYLTQGEAAHEHELGVEAEQNFVANSLKKTKQDLVDLGIPSDRIHLVLAQVKNHDGHEVYNGFKEISQ